MRKTVKKYFIPLVFLVLVLSSCTTRLERIDRSVTGTVFTGTVHGLAEWDGKTLPASPGNSIVVHSIKMKKDIGEAVFPNGPVLVIGPTVFPYRLWLNDRLVASHGEFNNPHYLRMFLSKSIDIDPEILLDENQIRIEIAVGGEPCPIPEIAIADRDDASHYVFWRNFFMSQFVTGGFAVALLLSVYFSVMFALGRERGSLWFALVCLAVPMAFINLVFSSQLYSDTVLIKISRVGFFLAATMMGAYTLEATKLLKGRRWIQLAELGLFLVASLIILFQKDFVSANSAFHSVMQFVITPNLVFCFILLVWGMIKHGIREHIILFVSLLGVIAASLYDMVFETSSTVPYAWLFVYGYLWMVVCIFMELLINQHKQGRMANEQALELGKKNNVLEDVFAHIQRGTDVLSSSTDDLAVAARETYATGNQQAAAVKEILTTMEEADRLLESISLKSGDVREDSRLTAEKADNGLNRVREALKKMESVINRINESIELLNNLNENFHSITDIVKFIEGLATQIRIIAFNASLEAVAAGDAGKNFMIVADEVKRLSDSTMNGVQNIRTRVNNLVSTSGNMIDVARQDYIALEQSWDLASGLGDTLHSISTQAESSANTSAEIDASIMESAAAFKQIVQTLKEIAGGISSFVESSSHTSEITAKLNDISEQLSNLLGENQSPA